MEFHPQYSSESFRDKLVNILINNSMIKEEYTLEDIKTAIPWNFMSNDIDSDSDDEDEPIVNQEVVEKPFSDNISDDADSSTDTITTEKPVKSKKEKKEKKPSDPDKIKRAPSNFIYFKSHPESQDAINEASQQLQGEDDKKPGAPVGKVKGAGIVWKSLSDEEKEVWKQRVNEEFNIDQ